MKILNVYAREILDSRGWPTVEAAVELDCGALGVFSAPSGASTGTHEVHERRDHAHAFQGKGVLHAVNAVKGPIADALKGMDCADQAGIDARMLALDGTENLSNLGANAVVAVSIACACAAAKARKMPLYMHLRGEKMPETLPVPMMNVINGGAHADNSLDIQEFMLVCPHKSARQAIRMGAETYHALKSILKENRLSTGVGDEGGFAPDLKDQQQALDLLVSAIHRAGYVPGQDISLAMDLAAGEWARDGAYVLPKCKKRFDTDEMIQWLYDLAARYPIVSMEDPLGEEDFSGFARLTKQLGEKMMIVGEDLFTTNSRRLEKGISHGAANAVLIKPNQIGTLTRTFETIRLAQENGYGVILSHRSGETLSTAIVDIAVAAGAQFLKAGAPCRGERVAKYNRLMQIEDEITRNMVQNDHLLR